MNQNILFSDELIWHESAIEFHAQQSGMLISCFISLTQLQALSSLPVEGQQDAFDAFERCRFDIDRYRRESGSPHR